MIKLSCKREKVSNKDANSFDGPPAFRGVLVMLLLIKTSGTLCALHSCCLNLAKLGIHTCTTQKNHVDSFTSVAIFWQTLTSGATYSHGCTHLCQEFGIRLEGTQSGSEAARYSDHSQGVTQTSCFLVGQASQGTDTTHTWAQVHHLVTETHVRDEAKWLTWKVQQNIWANKEYIWMKISWLLHSCGLFSTALGGTTRFWWETTNIIVS